MKAHSLNTPDYLRFVADLKARIQSARLSAARSVNRDLILLYWDIGRGIVEKQETLGWGESVVEMLARDLQKAFPGTTGFSAFNLWRMRQLYMVNASPEFLAQLVSETRSQPHRLPESASVRQAVRDLALTDADRRQETILEQLVPELLAGIPWGHHVELLKKVKDHKTRLYYLRATARFGWSRNVLLNQIKAGAYERAVKEKKTHNFTLALPEHLAEQADEMLKSRYNLEFLGIGRAMKERELENRLIARLQQFILELGYGFCFVGRQHRLALGKKEYFVDLLFYHRFLKALVAFDLKGGMKSHRSRRWRAKGPHPSQPGATPQENPIGMGVRAVSPIHRWRGRAGMGRAFSPRASLFCIPGALPQAGMNCAFGARDIGLVLHLRSKGNPIGVAEYQLQPKLPAELKGQLPTAKQLADAMKGEMGRMKDELQRS